MKLAIISPTGYLQEFLPNPNNRIHLALAQYVLSDTEYALFFNRIAESGEYVILDNGASELKSSITESKLLMALELSGAQEVVCPDVLFDGKNTLKRTLDFLDLHSSFLQKRNISTMAVCQGKSLEEWLVCYRIYQQDNRINTIGISNTARLFSNYEEWDHRIRIIKYLVESSLLTVESKPIHLLGLGSNGHWEINALSQEPSIRSIDTSAPVVHGYFNIRFERDQPYIKKAFTLDIDWDFSKEQYDAVIQNIGVLEKAIHNET